MVRADAYCMLHVHVVPHRVPLNVIVADRLGIPALCLILALQVAGMSQGCVAWVWNTARYLIPCTSHQMVRQVSLQKRLWQIDLSPLLLCVAAGMAQGLALMPEASSDVQIAHGKMPLYVSCQWQQVQMV